MTFVHGKNIVESSAQQGIKANSLNGFAKLLDSKFKTVFSLDEKAFDNPQNFNVQNNPFNNNTEKLNSTKQLLGGHSIDYVMSQNSVFESQVSNNNAFTENFRNEKSGNLDFDS